MNLILNIFNFQLNFLTVILTNQILSFYFKFNDFIFHFANNCFRWPGASLTIVRGHKHLHECTFIGDDSSEELEELIQVAEEKGLLKINGTIQVTIV